MVKITDVDATGSLRDPSGVEASSVCMDGWDCALSAARQINKTMRVRALKALVGGADYQSIAPVGSTYCALCTRR